MLMDKMYSPDENSIHTQSVSENADTPECINQELMKQSNDIEGAMVSSVKETCEQGNTPVYNHTSNVVPDEMTRDDITSAANALIDDLNNKRKQDTQLLEDFKKALELQVRRACAMVEERMFHIYEKQGKEVQEKLQELFAGIERIAKTEAELAEFREALRLLYTDIHNVQE